MGALDVEEVTIGAADGFPLAGRLFAPAGEPRGAALVAPALGVTQGYYQPFARWLAGEGVVTLTFDLRGTGLSLRGRLRDERANVLTWAEQDFAAALRVLADRAGALPINWIGHSLGGQVLPFVPGHERIARMITVAAGSGYWRDYAPGRRYVVPLLWWVVAPLSLALLGWFPGRTLGVIGDLPGGVMEQWRRWCLHPQYAAGAEGERARALYAAIRIPITSISFTDDEYMSARSIEALNQQYSGAARRTVRVSPQDVGMRRIGHLGFFRRGRESLWRELLLRELARPG